MTRIRYPLVLLAFISLQPVPLKAIQDKASDSRGAMYGSHSLELIATGEKILSGGHHGGFRIYAAPDGTKAQVTYAHFESGRDAKRQIRHWLKLAKKVTSKEQKKNQGGSVIGERVEAITQNAKSGEKEFLIIRRNGLNCYLVQSLSLPAAKQVENLIQNE